ncbi:RNA-binding protein squid-like isoform X1 [Vespula maculifrons]|uniref:RNA-binding protein squid-like isoform X1 n=1 Tax=Vespula maculifrons TaxID=7453 RepID=A0ABD2CKQ0_VESMC
MEILICDRNVIFIANAGFPPYKFHHKSSNHHHSINKQPRHLRQEQQRRQLPLNKFSHQDSQLKQ